METLFMLIADSGYRCEPIEKIESDTPRIEVTAGTFAKIKNIIDMSPLEVGWLSHVSVSDNIYRIDSCEIIEQKVMSAETEMTTQGLQNFMQNTIKEKGVKYFNDVRCWGHSHVNMAVHPSGQDQKQILAWKESDYEIMLIMNKRGELYSALYDFKNNKKHIGLPIHIVFDGFSEKQKKAISKELKKKVEERKWEPAPPSYLMQSANFDKQIVSDPFFVSDERGSMQPISQFLKQESMLEDDDGFVEVHDEDFKDNPSAIALSANRIHTVLCAHTTQTSIGYVIDIDSLCIIIQELTDCLFHFDEIDVLVAEGDIRDVAAVLFASIRVVAYPKEMDSARKWLEENIETRFDLVAVSEWIKKHISSSDAEILYSILDREFAFEGFASFVETLV